MDPVEDLVHWLGVSKPHNGQLRILDAYEVGLVCVIYLIYPTLNTRWQTNMNTTHTYTKIHT